jgi:hypothetical protein
MAMYCSALLCAERRVRPVNCATSSVVKHSGSTEGASPGGGRTVEAMFGYPCPMTRGNRGICVGRLLMSARPSAAWNTCPDSYIQAEAKFDERLSGEGCAQARCDRYSLGGLSTTSELHPIATSQCRARETVVCAEIGRAGKDSTRSNEACASGVLHRGRRAVLPTSGIAR